MGTAHRDENRTTVTTPRTATIIHVHTDFDLTYSVLLSSPRLNCCPEFVRRTERMTSAVNRSLQALSICCLLAVSSPAFGAAPTAEQALKLAPIQKDVDYDQPTAAEALKCTIKAEKIDNVTGWVVRDGNG